MIRNEEKSNIQNCDTITLDKMCVIKKESNGSLRVVYYPIERPKICVLTDLANQTICSAF